jgi:PAS domain S-box-containing protein
VLVTILGVVGFFLTTHLQNADRETEVNRRVQLESVRAQGVLSDARAFVAGLASVLQGDQQARQRRFAALTAGTGGNVGLIDVLWVQRVTREGRAAYERWLGKAITGDDGAPVAAADAYLPATFTSGTRVELPQGTEVSAWRGLSAAIEDRANVFAGGASRPGTLRDDPGFYLLQASDFGRGAHRRGYLAAFVPRGWLTVALEQDPRAFAISVDGRHLEGGLAKPSAAVDFESLGRRWRIAVAALPVTGLETALPWIALTGPALLSLLLVIIGRGILGRRRAERDFERIFHLSPDLLAIAGFDGFFRRVNPALERTFGFSTAELLARPVESFVHPDDHGRLQAAIAQLIRGEQVARFENRAIRADGAIRHLEWNARPLAAEGLLYAAARDVTDRRRTERELELLAGEQAALRRVATLVARDASPAEVLEAVVGEVRRLLDASSTRLYRYEGSDTATVVAGDSEPETAIPVGVTLPMDGENLPSIVQRAGKAARQQTLEGAAGPMAEQARQLGLHAVVGAPVSVGGRLWGVMIAGWKHEITQPEDTEARMSQFTELVAVAIANAEGRSQLAASRARVVTAADETRRRIERDLHDATQQRLVSLVLGLRATEASLPGELEELKRQLGETADGINEVLDQVQEISRGIHPAILTTGGLGPALRTLARRAGVPVELDLEIGGRLPKAIEVAAYSVVSEALTNAAKHADASFVEVVLESRDHVLDLRIRDDGIGGADPSRGSGLVGLRDRVEALGGSIAIASPAGRGTSLSVKIPIIEDRD